jgi:hypothetical protein
VGYLKETLLGASDDAVPTDAFGGVPGRLAKLPETLDISWALASGQDEGCTTPSS